MEHPAALPLPCAPSHAASIIVAGQQYRHDQFQLSGGWDLRHPRPWDKMTAVTTTGNLTTERTYLTVPASSPRPVMQMPRRCMEPEVPLITPARKVFGGYEDRHGRLASPLGARAQLAASLSAAVRAASAVRCRKPARTWRSLSSYSAQIWSTAVFIPESMR